MDVALSLPILLGLIAVALVFDFLNGVHDAANSIATIVSTRVLRPQYAVGSGHLSRSSGRGSWRGQGPSGACSGVWSATRG